MIARTRAIELSQRQKRLLESGIVAAPVSPEQLVAYADAETRKRAEVVKDANIKAEQATVYRTSHKSTHFMLR